MKNIKISDNEILNAISIDLNENDSVFVYSSYFEGLGNKKSDVDIYVIIDQYDSQMFNSNNFYGDCLHVEVKEVNNIQLDIEYWSFETIEKYIIDLLKTSGLSANYDVLKLLLRLYNGKILLSSKNSIQIIKLLQSNKFNQLISNRFSLEARSLYDDAVKMVSVNEYILALDCSRRALWEAVAFFNSVNGKPNLKEKWISKIFIENNGFGETDLLEEYLSLQIYCKVTSENIESFVLDMLQLTQNIMNRSSFI